MTSVDVDVLVVGGGPVGLAAGLLATRVGLSAAVVERRPDPIDKACGEGLMPTAVRALAGLGVRPRGRPFHGIRYVDAVRGRFAEARFGSSLGLGVRRTELQAALADRAADAGVARVFDNVSGVRQLPDRVVAAGVEARWLIAADGLHSALRQGLGLSASPRVRPRFGLRRHFRVQPWTDLVEVHWSTDAEAYVTPVSDHEVGVAVLTDVRGRAYDDWLPAFPALSQRMAAAQPASAVLGAGPLEQNVARRVAGRVLLVGDAAGYVDALTGEGVALGLAQARAAVDCVVAERPEDYERLWWSVTRRYRLLTRGVLGAAQRPALRRLVVPTASTVPAVFGVLVRALS